MDQFEKGRFRTKLFGGFNRRDVAEYIEFLATEKSRVQEENDRLTEELEAIYAEQSESRGRDDGELESARQEAEEIMHSAEDARQAALEEAAAAFEALQKA